MSKILLKIKLVFVRLEYFPLILKFRKSNNKKLIEKDIDRWVNESGLCDNCSYESNLTALLFFKPQFRNLFFYRLRCNSTILKKICPPDSSLTIAEDCGEIEGGAVYFEHAFGTHLSLNHVSEGAIIRQLTTFGVKSRNRHNERPWVGKNVDFGANVTCIGNIHIGDNAIIAAGSVVVKDVPENAIVAGNPARIIKYRDAKTIN